MKQPSEEYSQEETSERLDRALRRALKTPPKRHKPVKKGHRIAPSKKGRSGAAKAL
jgi:hypothetical protein